MIFRTLSVIQLWLRLALRGEFEVVQKVVSIGKGISYLASKKGKQSHSMRNAII